MTAQPEPDLSPASRDIPASGPQHDRETAGARDSTGFAWSCRKTVTEGRKSRRVIAEHHVSGSDRGEFDRHMRAHALVPPLKTSYRRWKPWKMPRGREYAPRPLDPGQPVEWDADGVTRTGVIWDRADRPNTWWAQPGEDPAHPVYLSRYGKDGPLHEVPGVADKARANIVRGNLVRQRGIYAVIHRTGDHAAACWHTDPDCPRAAGLERYDPRVHGRIAHSTAEYGNTWTALDIARELTADFQHKPKNLPVCPDCVTGLDIPPPRTGPAAPRPEPETRPEGNPDHLLGDIQNCEEVRLERH